MIRIGKDTLTQVDYNNEEVSLTPSDLPKFLGDTVELEDGVTFKRIFDLIILNRKIFDIVFAKPKGFFPIDIYLTEYLKEDDDSETRDIDYLEVRYVYDYWDYDNKVNIEPYVDFHGICENYTDDFQKEPCRMGIGISFTPLNQLKKYPIKINNEFVIQNFDIKLSPPKMVTFVKGVTSMKLYDFIAGILHEITWHGAPQERDKVVEDLQETKKRIDSGQWIIDKDKKTGNLKPFFDDEEN